MKAETWVDRGMWSPALDVRVPDVEGVARRRDRRRIRWPRGAQACIDHEAQAALGRREGDLDLPGLAVLGRVDVVVERWRAEAAEQPAGHSDDGGDVGENHADSGEGVAVRVEPGQRVHQRGASDRLLPVSTAEPSAEARP